MENEELINDLIQGGYLKTPAIIEAFTHVKREDFVPSELKDEAYINAPLPIGFDQTISQPLTVAFMLELLSQQSAICIMRKTTYSCLFLYSVFWFLCLL